MRLYLPEFEKSVPEGNKMSPTMRRISIFSLALATAAALSSCAALNKRLTGVECRPTGGLVDSNRQLVAPGNGNYIMLCDNGMFIKSETLNPKWLSQEEVAAAQEELRQQKKSIADATQAIQDEAMRRLVAANAAEAAARPKVPNGKALCESPLMSYLMYHDGCTRPGMEAKSIQKGCLVMLDDRIITRQKVPDGYLITGNFAVLPVLRTTVDLI